MEGFGKLYETDALHLAEIIAQLPRRSFDARTRMVLYCYANLYDRDGSVPYFNVGTRQLAEFAGCARKTARRFIEDMEKDGLIVRLGTMKTKSGEFTKRTFWWLEEGRVGPLSSPPRGTKPTLSSPGVGYETRPNDPTSEAELQKGRIAARPLLGARLAPAEEPDGTPTDADGNVMMPWEVGGDG